MFQNAMEIFYYCCFFIHFVMFLICFSIPDKKKHIQGEGCPLLSKENNHFAKLEFPKLAEVSRACVGILRNNIKK